MTGLAIISEVAVMRARVMGKYERISDEMRFVLEDDWMRSDYDDEENGRY